LGGGGARGVALVGVLKVLEEARVPIDIVTGTSAGAIIGGLYAAGQSPAAIEKFARGLTLLKVLGRGPTHELGLFTTDRVGKMIREITHDARIEDLPRKFASVAADLHTPRQVVFDRGPLASAICASITFPGVFAPLALGADLLIDGGVVNPLPFDLARQMGADFVIAVGLGGPTPLFQDPAESETRETSWLLERVVHNPRTFASGVVHDASRLGLLQVVDRALVIMGDQIMQAKLAINPPDVLIEPEVASVGLFDLARADYCLRAGEAAARAKLEAIRGGLAPRWREKIRRELVTLFRRNFDRTLTRRR
jgi:NTE family protein